MNEISQLIETFVEAFNRRDNDRLLELFRLPYAQVAEMGTTLCDAAALEESLEQTFERHRNLGISKIAANSFARYQGPECCEILEITFVHEDPHGHLIESSRPLWILKKVQGAYRIAATVY